MSSRTLRLFLFAAALLALATPAAAGGWWACRNGAWAGVGAPAHPRPTRACGERPAIPKTEADCRAHGGHWGRAGLFPQPICVLPTADAGRICGDRGECEGLCLADPTPDERRRIAARESVEVIGRCTPKRPVFGCMYIVAEGRVRGRLCAD
jgi:hypothetical protein